MAKSNLRIAIVVSKFNDFVTDRLLEGATAALHEAGVDGSALEILHVPGAFELPMAAQRIAETGRVSAVVCLGLPDSRRDTALRVHRLGVCERHHRRGFGDR